MSEDAAPDQHVHLEVAEGVAVLRMDRPKLNALNAAMQRRIGQLATECAERDDVAAVVLTGGERVFAAGADIVEMEQLGYADMVAHSGVLQGAFSAVARIPKPVVAAVNGYALGGGCELALCADVRIAAEDATLGQPEIKLGIIPGAGGTQRLPRAVGKAKAMDLALTGRMMDAAEAERSGLVSRVVPLDKLMEETLGAALQICDYSQLAVLAAKESVNRAFEGSLSDGVMFERRMFHALFATEDQKEGMDAFVNKRKAAFKHR